MAPLGVNDISDVSHMPGDIFLPHIYTFFFTVYIVQLP